MQLKSNRKSSLVHKLAAVCMALVMVLTVVPATSVDVHAAAQDIAVSNAEYYDSGAVKSLKATFRWNTASAPTRLVLMTKSIDEGELTNTGKYYDECFEAWNDVINYDNENSKEFGIISYTAEKEMSSGLNDFTFNFDANNIPLNKNATYYVYQWTLWSQWGIPYYYPDALITTIQVEDGTVKYESSKGSFEDVVREQSYKVTIEPGANMTKTNDSGDAVQENLKSGMEPVIYKANTGYIFSEKYSVATVNGIMVQRLSEDQIRVFGTPTDDTIIKLTAPTREIKDLEDVEFAYAYDAQRSPSFPVKNENVTLSQLAKPLINDKGDRKATNEGKWTLSKVGTYSEFKSENTPNAYLEYVVESVQDAYNLESAEGIVLHKLKDDNGHIAYGVVVAYNANEGVAVFIGDTHKTGGGYLLSVNSVSGSKTVTASEVATDWVATVYAVNVDDTENAGKGTTTVSASEAVEGVPVTVTATPDNGYKLNKITVTDASGANVAVADNKFEMPASDVTVKAEYVKKEFAVKYFADGVQVGPDQVVEYGADAIAPLVPEKEGYTGVWSADGKNITADTTITAVYTAIPADEAPQTSDNFNTVLFGMIAFAALIAACGAYIRREEK